MEDFIHFQNQTLTSNVRYKYNNSYSQSILTNFYKVSLWKFFDLFLQIFFFLMHFDNIASHGSKKFPFLPLFFTRNIPLYDGIYLLRKYLLNTFFFGKHVLAAGHVDMCSAFL